MEDIKHTDLHIKNRSRLTLNGVTNVKSFDQDYMTVETVEGQINVEGQGLKIVALVKESGEMEIEGNISGVLYSQQKKREKGLKKLFG